MDGPQRHCSRTVEDLEALRRVRPRRERAQDVLAELDDRVVAQGQVEERVESVDTHVLALVLEGAEERRDVLTREQWIARVARHTFSSSIWKLASLSLSTPMRMRRPSVRTLMSP